MISRTNALKKASSTAQVSLGGGWVRSKSSATSPFPKGPMVAVVANEIQGTSFQPAGYRSPFTSAADAKKRKRDKDRDFLISVLESTATKRDAKAYLQTFGPGASKPGAAKESLKNDTLTARPAIIRSVEDTPQFVQGTVKEGRPTFDEAPHVAIVKFRKPQLWDDDVLNGVAKTLTQLRGLGFLSVIVVDCGLNDAEGLPPGWRETVTAQVDRVAATIGVFGTPAAKVVDSAIWVTPSTHRSEASATSHDLFVGFEGTLITSLQSGHLVVLPSVAYSEESTRMEAADPNKVVYTLTKYLSGLQFPAPAYDGDVAALQTRPPRNALVDRIILIDPLGGIPSRNMNHGAQVFLNLEDQFEEVRKALGAQNPNSVATPPNLEADEPRRINQIHLENIQLAKDTLSILPSTSSVVITSPAEAANLRRETAKGGLSMLAGPVGSRRTQNPLIHNLLTDRPIYSSSLPIGRIKSTSNKERSAAAGMPTTTLAKRGLPVTVFPDTQIHPWSPPKPGEPRLRLTDICVDLPRLIHLINDSFNRKLDAEHYLARVNDNLAGIIIAGEYEGGAILTWERPFGLDEETAYKTGRLVPYLDKFAVLKRSQGAGGVADIVFNAMVRDCFPYGVCWRSRKDNPVNKWYFERSRGTRKLDNSNWVMFWTTPDASLDEQKIRDYEDVCRNVVPSWQDKTKAAD